MSFIASQPLRLVEPLISTLTSVPTELNNNQIMDIDCKHSNIILTTKSKMSPRKEIIEKVELIQEACTKSEEQIDDDEEEEKERIPSSPDDDMEGPGIKRGRSMSDGFAAVSPEYFEVFPSLPDSVLEKMGLLGDGPRERLNDEELEQKFVALALAFTIDAATIKSRCTRQRRYRDQTETNLVTEIDRLVEKVNRLHPLCVDAETTELLTSLLNQVDIILRASSLATISAERYGSVQHEERLAESVSLMINHVTILKQQRDSTRRQLQYTKRMLQDTNSSPVEGSGSNNRNSSRNQTANGSANGGNNGGSGGRLLTRRRASIATITQESSKPSTSELRKITRRPSDLSLRGGAIVRAIRPTRLELGLDLVKIREGVREENHPPVVQEENESEPLYHSEDDQLSDDHLLSDSDINSSRKNSDSNENSTNVGLYPLRKRLSNRLLKLRRDSEGKFKSWLDGGTLNEVFCFCALMCFSLSIIIMGNILVELECSKRGRSFESIMWSFVPFWTSSTTKDQNDYSVANT